MDDWVGQDVDLIGNDLEFGNVLNQHFNAEEDHHHPNYDDTPPANNGNDVVTNPYVLEIPPCINGNGVECPAAQFWRQRFEQISLDSNRQSVVANNNFMEIERLTMRLTRAEKSVRDYQQRLFDNLNLMDPIKKELDEVKNQLLIETHERSKFQCEAESNKASSIQLQAFLSETEAKMAAVRLQVSQLQTKEMEKNAEVRKIQEKLTAFEAKYQKMRAELKTVKEECSKYKKAAENPGRSFRRRVIMETSDLHQRNGREIFSDDDHEENGQMAEELESELRRVSTGQRSPTSSPDRNREQRVSIAVNQPNVQKTKAMAVLERKERQEAEGTYVGGVKRPFGIPATRHIHTATVGRAKQQIVERSSVTNATSSMLTAEEALIRISRALKELREQPPLSPMPDLPSISPPTSDFDGSIVNVPMQQSDADGLACDSTDSEPAPLEIVLAPAAMEHEPDESILKDISTETVEPAASGGISASNEIVPSEELSAPKDISTETAMPSTSIENPSPRRQLPDISPATCDFDGSIADVPMLQSDAGELAYDSTDSEPAALEIVLDPAGLERELEEVVPMEEISTPKDISPEIVEPAASTMKEREPEEIVPIESTPTVISTETVEPATSIRKDTQATIESTVVVVPAAPETEAPVRKRGRPPLKAPSVATPSQVPIPSKNLQKVGFETPNTAPAVPARPRIAPKVASNRAYTAILDAMLTGTGTSHVSALEKWMIKTKQPSDTVAYCLIQAIKGHNAVPWISTQLKTVQSDSIRRLLNQRGQPKKPAVGFQALSSNDKKLADFLDGLLLKAKEVEEWKDIPDVMLSQIQLQLASAGGQEMSAAQREALCRWAFYLCQNRPSSSKVIIAKEILLLMVHQEVGMQGSQNDQAVLHAFLTLAMVWPRVFKKFILEAQGGDIERIVQAVFRSLVWKSASRAKIVRLLEQWGMQLGIEQPLSFDLLIREQLTNLSSLPLMVDLTANGVQLPVEYVVSIKKFFLMAPYCPESSIALFVEPSLTSVVDWYSVSDEDAVARGGTNKLIIDILLLSNVALICQAVVSKQSDGILKSLQSVILGRNEDGGGVFTVEEGEERKRLIYAALELLTNSSVSSMFIQNAKGESFMNELVDELKKYKTPGEDKIRQFYERRVKEICGRRKKN